VALPAVVDLNAGAVEADDVASPRHGAADGVVVAAGDLDTEQEVAGIRTEGAGVRDGGRADAHATDAVGGDADEVALDKVPRRRRGERALDVDAVQGVPRGDVAIRRRRGADLVVGGVDNADAIAAVGHFRRAGGIDADE